MTRFLVVVKNERESNAVGVSTVSIVRAAASECASSSGPPRAVAKLFPNRLLFVHVISHRTLGPGVDTLHDRWVQ